MQLQFVRWLLSEMAHIPLAKSFKMANGVTIDSLDLRFEDYPKSTQEERNFLVRIMDPHTPPYYGQLPGGNRYLVFDGKQSSIRPNKPVGDYIELPQNFGNGYGWWDYAAAYHGNDLVKKPLRMRVYD